MKELLVKVAQGLVENPEAVSVDVDEPNEEGVTVYHLHVSQEEMGGNGKSYRPSGQNSQGNQSCHARRREPHRGQDLR